MPFSMKIEGHNLHIMTDLAEHIVDVDRKMVNLAKY
jgi:hypothetical protein